MMMSLKKSRDLGYHFKFFWKYLWCVRYLPIGVVLLKKTGGGGGGGNPPPPVKSDTADPNSEVEIGLKDWWDNFHSLLFFQNRISWKEGKALVFSDFYYYHKTNFSWKFNRNFSYHSEDFKIVFVNINYFHQFLDFLTFLVASKLIMSSYNRWCHDFLSFNLLQIIYSTIV